MRGSYATSATPLSDLPGMVRGAIVNDDDFKVREIGETQRVQAPRKVHGTVVDRYDYTQSWRRDMLIRVSLWTGCFRHVLKPALPALLGILWSATLSDTQPRYQWRAEFSASLIALYGSSGPTWLGRTGHGISHSRQSFAHSLSK